MVDAGHMRTKFRKILNMLRSFNCDIADARRDFDSPKAFAAWLLSDDVLVSPSRVSKMADFFVDDKEIRAAQKMLAPLVRAEEKIVAREATTAPTPITPTPITPTPIIRQRTLVTGFKRGSPELGAYLRARNLGKKQSSETVAKRSLAMKAAWSRRLSSNA